MRFPFLKGKDKRIGSAQDKRRYDLPLSTDEGTVFLALLIALMTFLTIMALFTSFILSSMTSRWSNGLEKQATIEIPAQGQGSALRSAEDMLLMQNRIKSALETMEMVQEVTILAPENISEMVAPWLGEDLIMDDLPLPGLISLKLYDTDEDSILKITETLGALSPDARLDTHERWLSDLFRLSSALHFASLFIVFIITVTTVTAVAGAIRSRMAIYRADIELLHLMGARDYYIMKQFQRHALLLALKGSAIGGFIALVLLWFIGWISGDTGAALWGGGGVSHVHILTILSLPFITCAIAALSARHTVLRVLALMP